MIIIDILLFLIVLGVNIAVHEFAHFYFAKRAGILCHEYAIGMGPAIYQKKKGETLYAIRAIPLGGYVSMAGEELADFVKKDNTVGIRIDDEGYVSHIILNNASEYDFIGKVIDFDLYGQNNKELFLELNVSGEINHYPVKRDAMYVLSEKKEMQVAPAERSFENKTLWERFLVVMGGPVSNFLIAFFILFFVGFFIQKPLNNNVIGKSYRDELKDGDVITHVNNKKVETFDDIINSIIESQKTTVDLNIEGNTNPVNLNLAIAFQGLGFQTINSKGEFTDNLVVGETFGRTKDLLENDVIQGVYIGKKPSKTEQHIYQDVETWEDFIKYIDENKDGEHIYLNILRDGNESKDIDFGMISSGTLSKLGARHIEYQLGIGRQTKYHFGYSLLYPFRKMGSDMKNMAKTIGLLFNPNSGVGAGDLAGPVGIFTLVRDAKSQGVISFFLFFAFLSINVGFLNLLPIPALDGGRLVFIAYEAITKKKVNKKVENTLITITFLLLLGLMVFVMFNDVIRLFG